MPVTTCPSIDTRPLLPTSFEFSIARMPSVSFFVTNVEIPSLNLQVLEQQTPLGMIEVPSDKLRFEPLSLEFIVDEQMHNWLEVFRWMQGLGFPEDYPQYTSENERGAMVSSIPREADLPKNYSDAVLIVNGTNNLKVRKFTFVDCFPTSLSSIRMSSQASNVEVVSCRLVLEYSYFTVE